MREAKLFAIRTARSGRYESSVLDSDDIQPFVEDGQQPCSYKEGKLGG